MSLRITDADLISKGSLDPGTTVKLFGTVDPGLYSHLRPNVCLQTAFLVTPERVPLSALIGVRFSNETHFPALSYPISRTTQTSGTLPIHHFALDETFKREVWEKSAKR